MSWLAKFLGFGSLSDPRGVRADFCDFCLTISPHWAYDRAAALEKGTSDSNFANGSSFQLCQICSANSPLPSDSILMPRAAASGLDIEELIEQTNPLLFEVEEAERIAKQISQIKSLEERRQMALQAFARAQEDLANDTFRLADLRIWGGLFLALAIGVKLLRRFIRPGALLFALVVPALLLYRLYIVPRLVRANLRPAWIRLLTGTQISFGELAGFLEANRQRFPRTARLLRAREYRMLGDDGLLHRDPLALQPGRDFLPASSGSR